MGFLWPELLPLLWALPLLAAGYLMLLRRRRRAALRYSSLAVVRSAMRGIAWRRHVPPALLLLACAVLVFAIARPVARLALPWAKTTVLLAMDVSLSMRVTDMKPSRIEAAQAAAKSFLQELPPAIEVGLITFAGTTQVVQPATLDRSALASAIDAFQLQIGTAVGNAIVMCLAELFPDHGLDLGAMTYGVPRGTGAPGTPPTAPKAITPVAPGSYGSAAIVLLTDGRRTVGIDTLEAAKMAADRGVRVHVVALGTADGGAAAAEGMAIYLQLDEPTLREVARMTGGEYHRAGSADALHGVYRTLGSRLTTELRQVELTAIFSLGAALLLVLAASLSMLWFGRNP